MIRQSQWVRVIPGSCPPLSAAALLRRAIGGLAGGSHRWAKGDFHVGGGACALGAIDDALAEHAIHESEMQAVEAALLANLRAMYPALTATTIPEINDDPSVTYEGIMAAFEKTAIQFEEKA